MQRQATIRIHTSFTPRTLNDWGALGAVVGRLAGNYWAVPVLEGIEDSTKVMAAKKPKRVA